MVRYRGYIFMANFQGELMAVNLPVILKKWMTVINQMSTELFKV